MKILVMDGSYNQSIGIIRSLGSKGNSVWVSDYRKDSTARASKYCKGVFILPYGEMEVKFYALLDVLKSNKFDLLIPVGSNSVRLVSGYREEIDKIVKVILPAPEKIFLALNKQQTYRLAGKLGIPVPLTIYPSSVDEVIEYKELPFSYPVVIKALEDTGEHIVEYAKNLEELVKKYKLVCYKYNFQPPCLPMIQELVIGEGYGFSALYQSGELKRFFIHHRVREYPVYGGASSCAVSLMDDRLKEHSKNLLDELQWNGVCMVEFKGHSGAYKLMELNPKFWGSLDLAICCGVDFPSLICDMADGKRIDYICEYKAGTKYHWPFSDDLLHIIDRPKSIPQFIRDFFSANSNIALHDIFPNILELKETLSLIARRCF